MENKGAYTAAAVTILVLLLAAVAYQNGWLSGLIPASWGKQSFVGAYGRTPGMEHCLAYNDATKKTIHFNRCNYV